MSKTIKGTMEIDGVRYNFVGTAEGTSAAAQDSRQPGYRGGESLPPLPNEYRSDTFRFVRSGKKEGTNARGLFTRYWAKTDEDEFIGTFDHKLGAELIRIAGGNEPVRIAFTENDRGKDFVGYPASDRPADEPAARPASKPSETPADRKNREVREKTQPVPASTTTNYDPASDDLPF